MPARPRSVLLALLLLCLFAGAAARAEDDPEPISEALRKTTIKKLGRQLRKEARSPHAPKHKTEILTMLEALEVLGGHEAGVAALGAVALVDAEVRDKAFELAEAEHHKALVKPLAAMLEDKRYAKDEEIRQRIARSLSIMGDDSAVPHLTALIRTDEFPKVVAAAADSLATYSGAPLPLRKDAVKRLVDAYTATWNLMQSIRPEDKIISAKMRKQWKVYGSAVRAALQVLTGEQALTRAQEWRKWWNVNKKRNDW